MTQDTGQDNSNQRPRLRERAKKAFTATGVPAWVTLTITFSGILGTYYLLPQINAQFEANRVRTQFVIESLNELKQSSNSLLRALALFNQHMLDHKDLEADFDVVLGAMSELSGFAVSLQFMMTGEKSQQVMVDFYKAFGALQIAIRQQREAYAADPKNVETIITDTVPALADLTRSMIALYADIGEVGGLRPPTP